ncbi:MAG: glycosyltransferase [Proteobacteria bacterium]|nr:glycosyltransferase [Pseudomonadota bacterium]
MITFIVMTYYPENLRLSLSRLNHYKDYPFKLLVHNDNPAYTIDRQTLSDHGFIRDDVPIHIVNSPTNLAHFRARMNCIRALKENPSLRSQWMLFIDDDDILLTPRLIDERFPVLNHNALVVHRLREVLSLIDDPVYVSGRSPFMEEEKPKMGCVGIPYDTETFIEFYDAVQEFLPTLYQIYGTERVMEPDDVIIMYLFRIFIEHKMNLTTEQVGALFASHRQDAYAYALTYLEARAGRYPVQTGVCDLRYSNDQTGQRSYEQLYFDLSGAFYKYLWER